VAGAEGTYRELLQALGITEGPARVEADFTGAARGTGGTAALQKVRVNLGDEPETVRHAFRHELVHVLTFEAAKRKRLEERASARFFAEGLAEYYAYGEGSDSEERRASRRAAAAAFERHRIDFELLCDEERLARRYDRNHLYALGEVFVAALVDTAGAEAPRRVLEALGREDAPKDLEGAELWRDTFQAAGLDLESVIAAWGERLEQIATAERPFLDRLPRVGGGVCRLEEDELVLAARPDLEEAFPVRAYRLRVRSDSSDDDSELDTYRPEAEADPACPGVIFRVPRDSLRGRRFEYQFGVDIGSVWPFYGPWQSASVPRG